MIKRLIYKANFKENNQYHYLKPLIVDNKQIGFKVYEKYKANFKENNQYHYLKPLIVDNKQIGFKVYEKSLLNTLKFIGYEYN